MNTDQIIKTVLENTDHVKKQQSMLQQTVDQANTEACKVNAILYGIPENNDKPIMDVIKEFMTDQCIQIGC